jgi:hypothetical protein
MDSDTLKVIAPDLTRAESLLCGYAINSCLLLLISNRMFQAMKGRLGYYFTKSIFLVCEKPSACSL